MLMMSPCSLLLHDVEQEHTSGSFLDCLYLVEVEE